MITLISFVLGGLLGGAAIALFNIRECFYLIKENRRLRGRIRHLVKIIHTVKTTI